MIRKFCSQEDGEYIVGRDDQVKSLQVVHDCIQQEEHTATEQSKSDTCWRNKLNGLPCPVLCGPSGICLFFALPPNAPIVFIIQEKKQRDHIYYWVYLEVNGKSVKYAGDHKLFFQHQVQG